MGRSNQELAVRRHWRVRRKIHGTAERPRFSVKFTEKHIHIQFIDDEKGVTLVALSSTQEGIGGKLKPNVQGAVSAGKLAAERAKEKKISAVVFDRGSNKYHGKVKALADAAREAGLKF
ncbi:MAG: 50S ribosomal protein L18 [Verrucomicrobiae bacterium]|nr:50S ribosomal protein L18 [Verrucomicrobiae bacterium]